MNMSFDITDARGRTLAQLDPMKLHLLPRPSGIENQALEKIIEEITPGSSRCRRLAWVSLAIGVLALVGVTASVLIEGRNAWDDLVKVATNPALIAPNMVWVIWLPAAFVQRRRSQRKRVTAIMLKHRRCPHCGYSLLGLPVDPSDGATVCPECAGAWRLDDAAIAAHCAATCCATGSLSAGGKRRLLIVALALGVMFVALGVTFFLK